MRQQGAPQPVSACVGGGMGDGGNDFILCASVYVGASEGGAMFKGCWEGNRPVFLGLYQLRCSHQIICHLFKNYLGGISEISLAVFCK